jgi:hypothetical protein
MLKKYLKEKGDAKVYELGQKSKQIDKDIFDLRIKMRDCCNYENISEETYSFRVSPRKEIELHICLDCGKGMDF